MKISLLNYYNIDNRDVGNIAKELQSANKTLNQLEAAVEAEKANRHSLLKQCKMESIQVSQHPLTPAEEIFLWANSTLVILMLGQI
jgi:predicted transcriptional regulator